MVTSVSPREAKNLTKNKEVKRRCIERRRSYTKRNTKTGAAREGLFRGGRRQQQKRAGKISQNFKQGRPPQEVRKTGSKGRSRNEIKARRLPKQIGRICLQGEKLPKRRERDNGWDKRSHGNTKNSSTSRTRSIRLARNLRREYSALRRVRNTGQ